MTKPLYCWELENERIEKITIEDRAKEINEYAQTLLAVKKLKYHDQNFLCNTNQCNSMEREILEEIVRLSAFMIG